MHSKFIKTNYCQPANPSPEKQQANNLKTARKQNKKRSQFKKQFRNGTTRVAVAKSDSPLTNDVTFSVTPTAIFYSSRTSIVTCDMRRQSRVTWQQWCML